MRLEGMHVTFKFTAGLVNVEQTYDIAFEPNERVDMTKWIFDKAELLEASGARPAVVKEKQGLHSPTARAHGANGSHPDDLTPELDASGSQVYCPKCAKPLYRKSHLYKSGRNKGKPGFIVSHADKSPCDYTLFLDERGK